jgi:hypothetical protein
MNPERAKRPDGEIQEMNSPQREVPMDTPQSRAAGRVAQLRD